MSTKKILNETGKKVNEKYGKGTVIEASKLSDQAPSEQGLPKQDNPPNLNSETQNNCNTDFLSDDLEILPQEGENHQEKPKSVFETLSKVDVNDKIEFKNKMKYLSWAWAWNEAKKHYPNMTSKVYETAEGINYFSDSRTCWVKVGVTIERLEHIEYYPVTDYKNASISMLKVTSFDVNTAIQRGLTKAIARHGLGLYIYAGEDLPETESQKPEPEKPKFEKTKFELKKEPQEQVRKETLQELFKIIDSFEAEKRSEYFKSILEKYHITSLSKLTQNQAEGLIARLNALKTNEVKTA